MDLGNHMIRAIFKLKNGELIERIIPVDKDGNPPGELKLTLFSEEINGEGKVKYLAKEVIG